LVCVLGQKFAFAATGAVGFAEQQAAKIVTALTKNNRYGEYIATWAIKN
jgi:hypothetical protein